VRAALLVNFWAGAPPGGVERVGAGAAAGLAPPPLPPDWQEKEDEAGGEPVEVEPVVVRLPPPPGGEREEGAPPPAASYGHTLSSLPASAGGGAGPGLPDLVVVCHAGYDLVEADGGAGCEPAWVVAAALS
jgi:hypothetical protein